MLSTRFLSQGYLNENRSRIPFRLPPTTDVLALCVASDNVITYVFSGSALRWTVKHRIKPSLVTAPWTKAEWKIPPDTSCSGGVETGVFTLPWRPVSIRYIEWNFDHERRMEAELEARLLDACEKGDVTTVCKLIKNRVDVNAVDNHGVSALALACLGGCRSAINEF